MGNAYNAKTFLMDCGGDTDASCGSVTLPCDPIGEEVVDSEQISRTFEAFPLVPFFDNSDSFGLYLRKLREQSVTHGSCISSIADFVLGGEFEVVRKSVAGAFNSELADISVGAEDFYRYIDFCEGLWPNCGVSDLMDVAYGLYENLKTYGNCLLRVDLVPVAGKKYVRISNVDFDNWRWVHTGNDLEKKVAISESWEWDFVNKHRLEIVNHWPYVTDKPNGQKSTVIFGRNRALSRKWYGLPDSIQSLRSQMLELQLMDSLNTGYATDFTGQVFFEFSSKAGLVQSEEPQSNGITASDLQFTSDLRQFYSKDSSSKRRVLWRRKHSDVDRTRVTQFTTDGRYKLDEFVSNEAKIKIIRAHNWHEVLLGDSTRGKLGQGKEIPELIKLKTKTNIRKIQNSLGGLLNHALDVAAQFTDKRDIVGEFGLGFRDIYSDLFPIEYEQARQIEEDRRVGRFGGSQGGG
jgi:hypothetical protein